jgi:hypothetical protein
MGEWPEQKFSNRCYTHNPGTLLEIAGLTAALDAEAKADPEFEAFWKIGMEWTEESRYDHSILEAKAKEMHEAVANLDHGVLPWLKKHW